MTRQCATLTGAMIDPPHIVVDAPLVIVIGEIIEQQTVTNKPEAIVLRGGKSNLINLTGSLQ